MPPLHSPFAAKKQYLNLIGFQSNPEDFYDCTREYRYTARALQSSELHNTKCKVVTELQIGEHASRVISQLQAFNKHSRGTGRVVLHSPPRAKISCLRESGRPLRRGFSANDFASAAPIQKSENGERLPQHRVGFPPRCRQPQTATPRRNRRTRGQQKERRLWGMAARPTPCSDRECAHSLTFGFCHLS